MITMLLTVLLIALIVFVAFWILDQVGLPHPFGMICKIAIAVIGIAALLSKTGLLAGLN
jgi:hypothetical protein